ncbi:MAG: hypothetical protein ABSD56_02975, partial [Bryobacteraceae bacterium]
MSLTRNNRSLLLLTLMVGLLVGALCGAGLKAAQAAPGPAADAKPLVIPDPVQLSTTFTQLAKQLEPAV